MLINISSPAEVTALGCGRHGEVVALGALQGAACWLLRVSPALSLPGRAAVPPCSWQLGRIFLAAAGKASGNWF